MTTYPTTPAAGRAFLDAWPERMSEYGYERISDGRCPRLLVGKRHDYAGCWCRSRLNDHAATYRRHGERVVLWEPYDIYPEELARVAASAAADGLHVVLSGDSPYNPGSTVAITFTRQEDTDQ